jgi:hypothetical protein
MGVVCGLELENGWHIQGFQAQVPANNTFLVCFKIQDLRFSGAKIRCYTSVNVQSFSWKRNCWDAHQSSRRDGASNASDHHIERLSGVPGVTLAMGASSSSFRQWCHHHHHPPLDLLAERQLHRRYL